MSETQSEYQTDAAPREPVLCYVEDGVLFFTTQPLAEQWGDDWGDSPYEYNAGEPYTGAEWEIVKVRYSGDFATPDSYLTNSPYSVEAINVGAVPWLRTPRYTTVSQRVAVYAGTTLRDTVAAILFGGGMVYKPLDGSLDRWLG
jgi:hypothetical protein